MSKTHAQIRREREARERAQREQEMQAARAQFNRAAADARRLRDEVADHTASFDTQHFTSFEPDVRPAKTADQLRAQAAALTASTAAASTRFEAEKVRARSRAMASQLPSFTVPAAPPTSDNEAAAEHEAARDRLDRTVDSLADLELTDDEVEKIRIALETVTDGRESLSTATSTLRRIARTAQQRTQRQRRQRDIALTNQHALAKAESELAGLGEDVGVARLLEQVRSYVDQGAPVPDRLVATDTLAMLRAEAIERRLVAEDREAAAEGLQAAMSEDPTFVLPATFLDDLRSGRGAVVGFADSPSSGCLIEMHADGSIGYDVVAARGAPMTADRALLTCERMSSLERPMRDLGLRYSVLDQQRATVEVDEIDRERIPRPTYTEVGDSGAATHTRRKHKEMEK